MSEQDTSLETNTSSPQLSLTPETQTVEETTNTIDWKFPVIAAAVSSGIIYTDLSLSIFPFAISIIFIILLFIIDLHLNSSTIHPKISENEKLLKNKTVNLYYETVKQTLNFFLAPLLTYTSITITLGNIEIPSDYHLPIFLISLIPLLPILIYHFHTSNSQPITNIPPSPKKDSPTIFEKIKSVSQIIPIIISISFMFVLIKNTLLVDNNLGDAIHLTAIEFTQSKYEWISFLFTVILIIYSTLLPSLALNLVHGGFRSIWKNQLFKPLQSPYIQLPSDVKPILHRAFSSIILTTLNNIILISITIIILHVILSILAVNASQSIAVYILLFSASAYINAYINALSKKSNNPLKVKKILYSSCLNFLLFFTVIFSLVFHQSTIYSIVKNSSSLGATISSPSRIINNSEETYYSCAFLDKPDSSESIAFGIIASSKDSSIHIFSPIRNEDTGKYAEKKKDGILYPNKLVETHVKTTEGYHIEKFNKSKHWFNSNSGKCVYKNASPFYVSSLPLERNE